MPIIFSKISLFLFFQLWFLFVTHNRILKFHHKMTDHYSIKKERNVHSFKLSHYSILQLHKLAKERQQCRRNSSKKNRIKILHLSTLSRRVSQKPCQRDNENDAFIKFVNKKRRGGGGGYKFRRGDRAKDKRETMKGEGVNSCNVKWMIRVGWRDKRA